MSERGTEQVSLKKEELRRVSLENKPAWQSHKRGKSQGRVAW